MPEYRRANIPGATYFFTVVAHLRQPLLTDPRCRAALRDAINNVRSKMPFEIIAWVLMPDHLHAVWQLPPDDRDFSLRWSLIKQHVTHDCAAWVPQQALSVSRAKRGEGGLWQRRFWEHLIRDEADFSRHLDYIITIQSNMVMFRVWLSVIRRFIATLSRVCSRRLGRAAEAPGNYE
jgi:putative transposase